MNLLQRRRGMTGAKSDEGPGWENGVPYDLQTGRVLNAYIEHGGAQASYSGWSCTDFLPCHGAASLARGSLFMTAYNSFYDQDKHFIKDFNLSSNYATAAVPQNAFYFRVSFSSNTFNTNWSITPYAE